MRITLYALALTAMLSSLGCASVGLTRATETNFQNVKVGQASKVVENQIGQPSSRTRVGNMDVWEYKILSEDRRVTYPNKLFFKNGILQEIRFDTAAAKSAVELNETRHKPGNSEPPHCEHVLDNEGHDTGVDSCDGAAPIR